MVSATTTSMRLNPPRASRTISRLRSMHDGHQVLHSRRYGLRQRDPVQRPLGPLDVDDELAHRMAAQPTIELIALEEGQRGKHAILSRQRPLVLRRVTLGG